MRWFDFSSSAAPILKFALMAGLAIAACSRKDADTGDLTSKRAAATEAYQAQDFEAFLEFSLEASALSPQHPSLIYNSAVGYTLTGKVPDALERLGLLADMGLSYNLRGDNDFAILQQTREFQHILTKMAMNRVAIVSSERLMTIPAPEALIEGLAYDPVGKRYYFGSVRQGRVYTRAAIGLLEMFITNDDEGIMSVMGMEIDPDRRLLWVATSALPQMEGYTADLEGESALLAFDLESGKLVHELRHTAEEGESIALNDLAIAPNGDVYASDARGTLWRVRAGNETMVKINDTTEAYQGLALSADGERLFVAAYGTGIWAMDTDDLELSRLPYPASTTLLGIDGLAYHEGSLLAVQNGLTPHRILRLKLNATADSIVAVEVLERNHPDHGEPTLGRVIGKNFVYVANSPWAKYDNDGTLKPGVELEDIVILSLPLR